MTENTSQIDPNSKDAIHRSRVKMLAILGFFFVPFIVAIVSYYFFPQLLDSGKRVNNAPLIDPIVTLKPFTNLQLNQQELTNETIGGRWTIIHRLGDQCGEQCEVSLYNTRQTRLGLGKDANRVQRVILGSNVSLLDTIGRDHPDGMLVLRITEGLDTQLQPIVERENLGPNDALLVDPLGNIMMAVPVTLDPSKLRKDLKKLLKLSKIG